MDRSQINRLLEERAGLIDEMRSMTVTAESENRDLTAEESQEFDRRESSADELERRARRMETLLGIPSGGRTIPVDDDDAGDDGDGEPPTVPQSLNEFRERRSGTRPQDEDEYRVAFYRWITASDPSHVSADEYRVLSKATAGAGLNLVPTSFRAELVNALREYGVMRQISRVITTDSGEAMQVPSVTSHGTAAWTAENAAYTPSDEVFGQASLSAFKAATIILVSEELLEDSAFDLEAYIRTEFGLRIGILENTAYVAGDGSGKPTGVATQASAGVTFASATAITSDELIDLYHSLLSPYRRNASWMFKDSSIKLVRKLKETTNQYLWQPGLVAGAPDTLLGRPVYADPDMAAATTGLVSVLFGDFSFYWIRDVNGIAFQRLNELYAANGQVGFRAYHRTDGKLLNTAAIKKGTQA
jgi:HK97 family phage major capsid protein